jgi:DNA-binding transcriptional regulator YbjK
MKPGFRYALGIVMAMLTLMILFQLRNMSRLRNHLSRLEGDTRALHSVLNSNSVSSMASHEHIRRLQRENDELREQLQLLSNSLVRRGHGELLTE